jgi:hypothetical protein
MSETSPPYPSAQCPTCQRYHSAALEPGDSMVVVCGCGKLLKIERGNGTSLVVREQARLSDPVGPEVVE